VLSDGGYGDVPIWITEMGWSTEDVGDDVRASYYRRAVEIVRADPRIAAFVAFELNQNDDSSGPHTGLVAADGAATASWSSYRQAVAGK
jgi:hypothetical protein